jgi:hypothetical protein
VRFCDVEDQVEELPRDDIRDSSLNALFPQLLIVPCNLILNQSNVIHASSRSLGMQVGF